MQFWFCETCGKRLTDKDLEQGAARNKKLKGVFCSECSVGVMTMEMDAINIKELAKAKPEQISSSKATPSYGTKRLEARTQPARSQNRTGEGLNSRASAQSSADDRVRAKSATQPILVGLAAAGVITVLAWVILASGEKTPPAAAQSNTASAKRAEDPPPPVKNSAPPEIAPKAPATPPESKKTEPVPETPPKPDTEIQAKADYEKMVKQVASMEAPPAERLAVIDAFLKDHADSELAQKAQTLKEGIATLEAVRGVDLPKPTEPSPPKEPVPPSQPEEPKPSAKTVEEANDKLFAGILKELVLTLQRGDVAGANKLLDDKLRDPANTAIVERLKKEKEDLATVQTLRGRAMEALRAKEGAEVSLKKGTMNGTVKAGSNKDAIGLALKGGPELMVTASQLDLDDIINLLPLDTGAGKAEDLRQRGLLYMAAGDTAEAEKYFTKAKDAGLGEADTYLARISALKQELKEAAAAEAWKKAEALFAKKSWKEAKQAYETLQRDFAGTSSLVANAETLKERLETIGWALGPAREISLDLGDGVKLEMVLIPAGEFEMGSNTEEPGSKPTHKIKISRAFYMGKYVVTQAQYVKLMARNPSDTKGDNLPASGMSFEDMEEFCKKAGKAVGKAFRLPTEAEWEYACRAGTKTKFYSGNNEAAMEQVGWFDKNSGGKPHPVGEKKPNAWGLYDMHGNVCQMTQDWFVPDYYSKSPAVDPPGGTPCREGHIIRGGCIAYPERWCTSAWRAFYHCAGTVYGFRVVLVPKAP